MQTQKFIVNQVKGWLFKRDRRVNLDEINSVTRECIKDFAEEKFKKGEHISTRFKKTDLKKLKDAVLSFYKW